MTTCVDIYIPGFSLPLPLLPFAQWMKELKRLENAVLPSSTPKRKKISM